MVPRLLRCLLLVPLLLLNSRAQSTNEVSIFPDKNLEAAVRQQVFAKRYTNSPLTAADVANVSTVIGNFRGISDLSGLEHCKSLAALELAGNKIKDLKPISGLRQLQQVILTSNKVSEITPLGTLPALQYIELSHNGVKDIAPLSKATNLASVYVGHNKVASIAPLTSLPRLVTLYAESNEIRSIAGLQNVRSLSGISLSGNRISDASPLAGLRSPTFIFLEKNRVKDLSGWSEWVSKDLAGPRSFAPYLQLYLKGNPLNSKSKTLLADWSKQGMRVNQ